MTRTITTTVIFIYGTFQLVLRNPEFGNIFKYEQNRINRKSRGGELVVFRDWNVNGEHKQWPETETISLTFNYLSNDERNRLIEFLKLTVGKVIEYHGYEGEVWYGVIINPDHEITQEGRCNHVATIEFQRVLL